MTDDVESQLDLAEQDVAEKAANLSQLLNQYTQQIEDNPSDKDAMSGLQGQIDSAEQDLQTATTNLNEALDTADQHLEDSQSHRDSLIQKVEQLRGGS